MEIKDGTGTGYKVGVNSNNHMKTLAVTVPFEHFVNHALKLSYSLQVSYTPVGAACCLYIKNTHTTMDMSFSQLRANVDTNCQLEVVLNSTGTPAGGADATPVNLNGGSSNLADGTFYGGAAVTGITKGRVIMKVWLAASNATGNFELPPALIVPPNGTMTWHLSGAATINATLFFNYHSEF